MTADTAVIIVNYNTRIELAACLTSLFNSRPSCVTRVVVVDNASTDGSQGMLRARWPEIQLIQLDRNIGFGAANNVALRQCQEPHVLLLNSDTGVPAGAIDRLRDRMLATHSVAAGPRLIDEAGRGEVSFGSMLTPFAEAVQRWRQRAASRPDHWAAPYLQRYLTHERFVDWVSGACLLLNTGAARAAGFFDERYFMYEEDVDLCAALRAAGGTILYTPAAEIVHLRGRSLKQRADRHVQYDRSHVAFYEKHAPGWAPWLRFWLRVRGRGLR
jgi:GT2 family glycosyltransferase